MNIIGEHIDYSGYSVLPIAIAQCIEVAVSVNNTNIVHISNFDKEHYDNYTCKVINTFDLHFDVHLFLQTATVIG